MTSDLKLTTTSSSTPMSSTNSSPSSTPSSSPLHSSASALPVATNNNNNNNNSSSSSSSSSSSALPLGNHCTCCHICHTSMKTSKREFFHCMSCTSVLCIQCVENYIIGNVHHSSEPEHMEEKLKLIKQSLGQWRCLKCEGKCPCKRCKNRSTNHSHAHSLTGKRSAEEFGGGFLSAKVAKAQGVSSSSALAANALYSYATAKKIETMERRKAKATQQRKQRSFEGAEENDDESTSSSSAEDDDPLKSSAKLMDKFLMDRNSADADRLGDLRSKWEKCEFYREQMTNFLELIQQQQTYVQQQIEKLTRSSSSAPSSPSAPSSIDALPSAHSTSVV